MKNLFLTLVFALALVPTTMAKSQTQMLCNDCTDQPSSNWIVMSIAG